MYHTIHQLKQTLHQTLSKPKTPGLWRGPEKGCKVCEGRSLDALYQILPLLVQ